jgi:alkanesulfonate monooxygenase SsuD/methylene tetrahydromethanopterin reductase-like flavin-dependent oxidoreductase (luciferase family)
VKAFIIARETEDEARAILQEIIDKTDPEAVKAFGHEVKTPARPRRRAKEIGQNQRLRISCSTTTGSRRA